MPDEINRLVNDLRLRRLGNPSYLGTHTGLCDEAADLIEKLSADRDAWKRRAEAAEKTADGYLESARVIAILMTAAYIDVESRANAAKTRCDMLDQIAIVTKKDRDAAVSDLETIMAYGNGNLDTCQFCKNGHCSARGGTKLCLPKWRGRKET